MTAKIWIICALAACTPPKVGETLAESIRAYNDNIRWERYDVAAVHLPPTQRSQRLDEWDQRSKDLKVTDYDIVKVDQKGSREALVTIKVSWYRESEGTLHETHAVQTWQHQGKNWMMVDESRLRGTEMPGLPEPLMKDQQASDLGPGPERSN